MCGYGRKLQDFENGSVFAASLIEAGDALKQMADLKYALDDNVKQNFLEPLHHTQTKDLKEVFHHRKKLQGRKLDFDCKKRWDFRSHHDMHCHIISLSQSCIKLKKFKKSLNELTLN